MATRVPPHIGLSLAQLDIGRTTGVETHFGKFTLSNFGGEIRPSPPSVDVQTSVALGQLINH